MELNFKPAWRYPRPRDYQLRKMRNLTVRPIIVLRGKEIFWTPTGFRRCKEREECSRATSFLYQRYWNSRRCWHRRVLRIRHKRSGMPEIGSMPRMLR